MSRVNLDSSLGLSASLKTSANSFRRITFLLFTFLLSAGIAGSIFFADDAKGAKYPASDESSHINQKVEEHENNTSETAGDQQGPQATEENLRTRTDRLTIENEALKKRLLEAESTASTESERAKSAGDLATLRLQRLRYFQAILHFEANNHSKANRLLESIPPKFRNFEWYYLRNHYRQSRVWFKCGNHGVHRIALRPNGKEFAVAARNGKIYVHDAETGYEDGTFRIEGHKRLESVAWSPNGKLLVKGRWGGAEFYDVKSGKLVNTIKAQAKRVGFGSDRNRFFVAGKNEIAAWSLEPQKRIWKENYEGKVFQSLAVSGDNQQVAAGDDDGQIFLLNAKTGELQHRLRDYRDVRWLEYSHDSSMLAIPSGSVHHRLALVDSATGQLIREIKTGNHRVTDAKFSADDLQLLTGGEDATVKIWDTQTGTLIRSFSEHRTKVNQVCWNLDGTEVVSGDGWGNVRITPVEPEDRSIVFEGDSILTVARRQSDGQLASGGRRSVVIRNANGNPLRSLPETKGRYVLDIAYSPDSKLLAVGMSDGRIALWDPDAGERLRLLEKHDSRVWSVVFSADSKKVISGGQDDKVKVWSVESGKLLHTLNGHKSNVYAVADDPRGKFFVSAGWYRNLFFWDRDSGKRVRKAQFKNRKPRWSESQRFTSMKYSPDGKCIAAGTQVGELFFFDGTTGVETGQARGHADRVRAIAFSPDGTRLATGSSDHTVRIWDTENHEELYVFKGHTSYVEAVCFNADGSKLFSGSRDGTFRVWDATEQSNFIELDDVAP